MKQVWFGPWSWVHFCMAALGGGRDYCFVIRGLAVERALRSKMMHTDKVPPPDDVYSILAVARWISY